MKDLDFGLDGGVADDEPLRIMRPKDDPDLVDSRQG